MISVQSVGRSFGGDRSFHFAHAPIPGMCEKAKTVHVMLFVVVPTKRRRGKQFNDSGRSETWNWEHTATQLHNDTYTNTNTQGYTRALIHTYIHRLRAGWREVVMY